MILRRFLNSAKRLVINHNLQLFAMTSEGYLRPIYIIVKLYPQMSDKIIIVGFAQCLTQLDGFSLPKSNELRELAPVSDAYLETLTHHYLISDVKGTVTCVSEGLWKECGIHSSFFDCVNNTQPSIKLDDIFLGSLSQ